MKRVVIGCIVLVYAAIAAVRASQVQLPLTVYDQSRGLSSLSVIRLLEDRNHFVWAGTEQGLYRFDGVAFRQIEASQGFSTSEIVSLAKDDDGLVWAGTREGLQRQGKDERFYWVNIDGRQLLVDRGQTMAADGYGGMFAVSGHHLFHLSSRAGGGWQLKPLPGAGLDKISILQVNSVYRYAGNIWFGCGDGICRLSHESLTRFGPVNGVPIDRWVGFLAARDGTLWGRGLQHVVALNRNSDAFTIHDMPGHHGQVAATSIDLAQDQNDRILTRSDSGLARWDKGKWELFDTGNGMPGVGISSLIADHQGMIWAGTYGRGILYFGNDGAVENWASKPGSNDSLVWSMSRGNNQSVWVAGEDGAELILPERGAAHHLPLHLAPPVQAHAVLIDGDGSVWYFLFDGRVVRYDPKQNKSRNVAYLPYLIRGAFRSTSGHVWIYTMGGLFKLDPGSGSLSHVAPGLIPWTMCSDMAEDDAARLWLACNSGLYRHNIKGWSRVRVSPRDAMGGYENVTTSQDGKLWLSSLQPGLFSGQTSDADALVMKPVADELLATTRFYFLRTDHVGRVWAGGGKGVDILTNDSWTRLSSRDGLLWDETNHGAFLADRDGSIWIGTPVGLTHILKPDQLLAPRVMHPLVLSLLYGAQAVPPSGLPYQSKAPLVIELGVAGNSAGHPVRFRYRLVPLEREWAETAQEGIRYASLPWGHYHFEVQVIDENRRSASDVICSDLTVRPPWWMTPEALAALLLLMAGLVMGLWRWRTQMLIAHARRLDRVVVERTSELRMLLQVRSRLLAHIGHDLRTPLSAIVNVVREWRHEDPGSDYPRVIERYARRQMELIDELLEFCRGELTEVPLDASPGYLYGFLHDVAAKSTVLAGAANNQLEICFDMTLPPIIRVDFRRLRQVLLNLLSNAAKYTNGGLIIFRVGGFADRDAKLWHLYFSVEDDGIGLGHDGADLLLKPFSRGSNVNDTAGSGLGLAIVTQLLGRMGSMLNASNNAHGPGSCFLFEIVVPVAEEHDVDFNMGGHAGEVKGNGRMVVVAEPNPLIRGEVCDLLDGYGFHTIVAESVLELIVMLRREPDLIVTEHRWPGTEDGAIVGELLLQRGGLPILFYTAVPPSPEVLEKADPGNVEVLLKPSDAGEFMANVARILAPCCDEVVAKIDGV